MDNELNNEIVNRMQERINELKKEDAAIDFCLGKGVTVEKSTELGNRQNEINAELDALKEESKRFCQDPVGHSLNTYNPEKGETICLKCQKPIRIVDSSTTVSAGKKLK